MDPTTPPPPKPTAPIAIPPDILAEYRRRKRFETQTPVVGMGCFTIIAFVVIVAVAGPFWYYAVPTGIIGGLIALYRYRAAQDVFRAWEDELAEWHHQR
jgi:hypothetical protein